MSELGRFEGRVATAVRAFADRADTRVDPVAVAEMAISRPRFASLAWLEHSIRVMAPILLVLGLLLALLAWSVVGGAPWDRRTSIVPMPAPTAVATAVAAPTVAPVPTTDGTGAEHVTGTGTFSIMDSGTSTKVGDVTQIRGFVTTSIETMNDPRVSGTGTLRLSLDAYGAVGPEWGTYRLENPQGAWEGMVFGAVWNANEASSLSGWLVGSRAYEGYTYYIQTRSSGFSCELDGIIFPGPPPGP